MHLRCFMWPHSVHLKVSGCSEALLVTQYDYSPVMGAAGIAQSVWRLATGWTVRGSNPGGGKIFRTRPDLPWGPPSLLYNGYRVFSAGKAAGAWC